MNPPLPPGPRIEPTWFTVALAEIGVQEHLGGADNPRIQEYIGATTLGAEQHDEVPWCSAFANWCLRRAGMVGTGKPNARSWLGWGTPLKLPKFGCVVVFSRDSAGPKNGHVGFYAGESAQPGCIKVLGGNQHNRVSIADYPLARMLGYRWPRLTPPPMPAAR